ncbi:hypothetical protein PJL18_04272 [Paenarthrobacter nicotinovorans]|nr:hypothetical protein [Paenarthrobacter nicotinovorans]
MFDAVDVGIQHVVDCVLRKAVRRDPGTFLVGGSYGVPDQLCRKRGRQVANAPVDPVAYELHPTVAVTGLLADGLHQLFRFNLMAQSAQVPTASGDVAAGPDKAGQVRPLLHPTCVAGRSAVADQQGSRSEVGLGLREGGGVVHGPTGAQSDMAVGIHETRQDPTVQYLVWRGRRLFKRQRSPNRPHSLAHVICCHEHGSAEFNDVGHGKSLIRWGAAGFGGLM